MKTLKTLSLILLIGLFTNALIFAQVNQELDFDNEIAKLEMKAENSSAMSMEQYDKLMDQIAGMELEKEKRCENVYRLIDGLSAQQKEGSILVKTPNTFEQYMVKLIDHIDQQKLTNAQVHFILQELNKEYNFYDRLIANGHDESLSIVIKAKQFNDKTTVSKEGFEIFRENYTSWAKTRKPETVQRSAKDRLEME
jgi:hypothetical protein